MIRTKDYRQAIAASKIWWWMALLLSTLGWALCWWVDRACEFVVLRGRNENGALVANESISRGTQQGMLLPDSSCQAWGKYNDLELSSRMATSRVSAATSIVLGAFLILWVLLWPCFSKLKAAKMTSYVISALSLAIAVFQALTHLMVKSELCEESTLETTTADGMTIVWDLCEKSTPAYTVTFVTMALYVILVFPMVGLARNHTCMIDDKKDPVPSDGA